MNKNLIKKIRNSCFLPPETCDKWLEYLQSSHATSYGTWMLEETFENYEQIFKDEIQKNISKEKYEEFLVFSKGLMTKILKNKHDEKKLLNLFDNPEE